MVKKIVSEGSEFVYSYNGNKILKATIFGQHVDYSYSGDLIASVKRFDSFNSITFETNYTYGNNNLVQEITFDYVDGIIIKVEFTFDNHNNPFKNVVGFSKIFSSTSENEFYRNIISRKVFDENNILVQSYENEYSYNQNEYPETRTTFFNGSTSIETTSQFYY
ncbi:MAG: hypothetical protein IE891_01000 [Flavobacteriaceae bacterium]|nr:hypothetical protein [Flavobacteriaceae bacterium]